MVISFTHPYVLLAFLILIPLLIYSSKRLSNLYKLKKIVILSLRGLLFTLLILALAGLNIRWNSKDTTTVFLLDASDSMLTSRSSIESFVGETLEKKSPKDSAAVIVFGDNAQIESFVSKSPAFNKIETKVNGTYTNIENAITSAISVIPQNSKKRIVLITDSEENEGKASKTAASLIEQGISLQVYKIEKTVGSEVALDSINVPQKLSIGEDFNLIVNITSTVNTSGKLTLLSGRDKVAEESIELTKGSNSFVFKDRALNGGFKNYKVIVEPASDTEVKNNEASAFTNIKASPKVLVIEDTTGEADELEIMLKASGIDYTRMQAAAAPRTLQELTTYKTVITANVSAENLNEGFLNSLEPYVKDFGGGFIATGGDNSFALGGYFKTPLEKVLPVEMEMKGKKEIPEMSMMLIIDKSGSMTGGTGGIMKLDVAKEAAARTLDSLRPKDEIGVLTFDDTFYWVVKPKKAEDREAIREDIGTIRPGGGTSILPALEEGYNNLKKSTAKIKHIILLTDGQAESSGYDELVEKIKKDNITVSTVAVGQDADKMLLERIAKGADGRFYITDDIANIPRIFAKETFMAAKAYLNNREFTPVISNSHPIIDQAAEGGLPTLLGYIGATQKDAARVILRSDEDDPILTVWQYGLGKTAAWNSDISGKWSQNYIGWENNLRLWQNIINYTVDSYESEDASIEAELQGGKGIITFKDKVNKEEVDTKAVVVTPSLQTIEVKLFPTSPGQYGGSFEVKEPGVYMLSGTQTKNSEVSSSVKNGLAVQYSPEYKISWENSSVDALVQEAGGAYIKSSEEVFKGELKDVSGKTDLTNSLLIITILLLIMDIAFRRLNLALNTIAKKASSIKDKATAKKKPKKAKIKLTEAASTKKQVEKEKLKPEVKEEEKEEIKPVQEKPKKKDESLNTSELLKRKKNIRR
jgi:uncharacterized membrane protein